jgi:hypothetical protein
VDSSPGTGHPQRRGVHQSGATSADLGQGPARAGLHGLGQATEHVGELVGPSRAGVWSSGTRHGAPPTAQGRRRRRPPPAPASHGAVGRAAAPPSCRWTPARRRRSPPAPWCRRRARPRPPGSTAGPAPTAPGSGCRRPSSPRSPGRPGHGHRRPGSRPARRPAAGQPPRLTAPPPSRRTPPAPARSRRWTAHAGTAAAAPRQPWGSCGTTTAGSPIGTASARRSPGRCGGRPPAGHAPRSRRPRS